ncbi:MAG: sigma 54-interacting transcriptional regulator, partial [bacterium]
QLPTTLPSNSVSMPVALMTGVGTVGMAASAMTLGAFDVVTKPLKVDELVTLVEHALKASSIHTAAQASVLPVPVKYRFGRIVAESLEMKRVCHDIEKAAMTSAPSLICGELGTGKSLLARIIHDCSPRGKGKFVVLNCAELPEPVIEERLFGIAGNSRLTPPQPTEGETAQDEAIPTTILLDEIVMMPPELLEKLVVHLAKDIYAGGTGQTTVMRGIILSADTTLESLSKMGGFASLISQITGVKIELKPLRERNADILPLLAHFLFRQIGDWNRLPLLEKDVQEALLNHAWPGNHSEMYDLIEFLLPQIRDGRITRNTLPPDILGTGPKNEQATRTVFRRIDHRGKLLKQYLQQHLPG